MLDGWHIPYLLDTVLRTLEGRYCLGSALCPPPVRVVSKSPAFFGDHRGGAGDIQKDDEEDNEEVELELEELPDNDGNENLAIEDDEGVASSFGDFS